MIPMLGLQCHSNNLSLQHDYGNMVLENDKVLDSMKLYINVELLSHGTHKNEILCEAGCKNFVDNNKKATDHFLVVFTQHTARFST